MDEPDLAALLISFQWAPTLGGECYREDPHVQAREMAVRFQWAPTLGGECYKKAELVTQNGQKTVSMGTHPWG